MQMAWERSDKSAEYIAARREKVDKIYEDRKKEKLGNYAKVIALKERRVEEKMQLSSFVTNEKLREEERAEEEFKATVALDAQRRRQTMLAQVCRDRGGKKTSV